MTRNNLRVRQVCNFPSLHENKNPSLPDEDNFYRPYLSDEQTIAILDILYRLKPNKCFEFGAGNSTVFFSKYINGVPWISVEHLDIFVNFIKNDIGENVKLIQKNIGPHYFNEIKNHISDGLFDFIFVDGELRPECINVSFECLNKGGILILHDFPENKEILYKNEDLRLRFEEYGCVNSFWWGRK